MFKNLKTFHHRLMSRYLKRHGWVVFCLEEQARQCNECNEGYCWLKLYQDEEKRLTK